jgi:hypothetical protein
MAQCTIQYRVRGFMLEGRAGRPLATITINSFERNAEKADACEPEQPANPHLPLGRGTLAARTIARFAPVSAFAATEVKQT